MKRPESDLEALREDLTNVYDGHPWHGTAIADVLSGVDAQTAARRTIATGHTIWELVLHMAVWTREVTARVRGRAPASPAEDWPNQDPAGGETAWRAAQEELATAHRELVRTVADLNPEDLVRWIEDRRDPSIEAGVTVGTLLRGLLQHHTYHEGQIAILKRAAEATKR